MTDHAFIVCADIRYLPEVVANLNSLDYVGNKQDVHFYGYKIPEEVIKQFSKLNYEVVYHKIEEADIGKNHGLSEIVCRKRYAFANQIGQDYKAICVLDADLIFIRDPIQYFVIAEKTGYVLGPSKEQNKVYDDPHHQYESKWIISEGYYNTVDMCNCPLFVDAHVWGPALQRSWDIWFTGFDEMKGTNFKAPDMDAMNVCLIEAGSADKTILLSGCAWLGTNEQHLKPYIRAVMDRDKIKTESGIPIFSYHGHYYHKKWRDCQLDNRHRCAEGYLGCSHNTDNMARGVMSMLYDNFLKMLDYKIKIERLNYRHPETEYEG